MISRLILLFLLFSSNLVWGINGIAIVDDKTETLNLGQSSSYLIDPYKELSFEAVMSEEYTKRFRPINNDFLQFGLVKGNIWIRSEVAIKSSNKTPILLSINSPRLQYLDIYLPSLSDNQALANLGEARPYNSKIIYHPHFLFPIPHNTPPIFTLYLKLSSDLPINAQITLKTPSKISQDSQKDFTITGILVGTLLIILIGNIFLFLRTYRAMYLIYGVFLFGIVLLHLALHGQLSQFFPDINGIQERIYNFSALMCSSAIVFFSRLYLDSKNTSPNMDKLLLCLGYINGIAAILFAIAPTILSIAVLSSLAALTLITLTIQALIAFTRSIPFSGYYLVARLTVLFGHLSWLMSAYGIIPSPIVLEWGLTTSITVEALIHFIGLLAQTGPLLKKNHKKSNFSQVELFDLLSDLSSRLRRQVNIIEGGASLAKNSVQNPQTLNILETCLTANENIKMLIERVNFLGSFENPYNINQKNPILLNTIIENANTKFENLDQDNSILELNTYNIDNIEILQDATALQHIIEFLALEFKHFTDHPLTISVSCQPINREGITKLKISCFPLPSRIKIEEGSLNLGMSYILLLIDHLGGDKTISSNNEFRSLDIEIPILSHLRRKQKDTMVKHDFNVVILGQEDNDLQQALNIVQNISNSIEHLTSLETLLDYLEDTKNRKLSSIILIFDNGGHIPHITQQRVRPLMKVDDQCLLITNNVKMSLDYAKRLGFDELLSCSEIQNKLDPLLSRLIKKSFRLKSVTLSRIKSLNKSP